MKTHILGAKTGRTACGRWLCMSKLDMTQNLERVTCTGCLAANVAAMHKAETDNAKA